MLRLLPPIADPNVLVGPETSDESGRFGDPGTRKHPPSTTVMVMTRQPVRIARRPARPLGSGPAACASEIQRASTE